VSARKADALLDPWWARLLGDEEPGRSARWTLAAVLSTEFPPHTVVDLPGGGLPSGWQVAVTVAGDRVENVAVDLPGAPLLWYVELTEPAAVPAATTMVAFSDARRAEGRLITESTARSAGVSAADQVGAVRWWPGEGLVHQVYVRPEFRRRGVAGKLVQAAAGVQAVRGGPPLHGDGRRTELGEQWRQGLPGYVAQRLAERTHVVPPMTPGE
jgi:GNAT superfamily N-acetyltransferase